MGQQRPTETSRQKTSRHFVTRKPEIQIVERREMDPDPQRKRRKTRIRIPKVLLNRHVSIVVVNNVIQEEQSVPRSSKRAVSVTKRAILHPCVAHQKKCNNLKKTKKALMKAACSGNCLPGGITIIFRQYNFSALHAIAGLCDSGQQPTAEGIGLH